MRRSTADNPFPPITLIKSVKMWQRSYFYVKNLASDGDWVNLPPSPSPAAPRRAPPEPPAPPDDLAGGTRPRRRVF